MIKYFVIIWYYWSITKKLWIYLQLVLEMWGFLQSESNNVLIIGHYIIMINLDTAHNSPTKGKVSGIRNIWRNRNISFKKELKKHYKFKCSIFSKKSFQSS